ncbi:alpha-xylosidase [Alkalihalobacillus trypoxylicola]|uniref:alpha-D-xyloside xylohydrolase n=1 Tax=Alkalihalobacillus trypoxylicola TaxID=519424 RepID=A0A162DQD6_9BACI|nr:alpha-xylosidase [Alkalihalobacillus trypoxylicola]KYG30552.1 alpha-xylosidase [Alkalihalobacillus trypoxylicola]
MKIIDGNWMLQPGIQLIPAVQHYETIIDKHKVTFYVAPRDVTNRYSQLDVSLLTVELTSPLEDIIKVKVYHHKGIKNAGPNFELNSEKNQGTIEREEKSVLFSNGQLKAHVQTGEHWGIQFFNGNQPITSTEMKSMAYVTDQEGNHYMREELSLSVSEKIYGLGERFTPFIKNGQVVDIWNEDGGTSTEQSYKNIPFYLSNKGYGVFINQPEKVSLEVGSERVSKVQFSVEGESLEYFIIGGKSLKKVLENYTTLTGKPSLPPAWSFGLWLSTSFTTNYDEKTVTQFVEGMKEREIPLRVFHFDCFWMKGLHWSDFEWDQRVFPDPKGMLERLKDKNNLQICVWINPYIAQQSSLFDEGVEKGYFVKTANGDVWQWDRWQPGMALVDFTNPDACHWFKNKLRALISMGVDSFKTDFGERIPTDVIYHNQENPFKMHNYYTYLYNQSVFEVLQEEKGENEAVLFARSATVGGQKFPVHWGGDCYASYESMAESLRGGLSLGLSGFGFWSHDIGGFEQNATPDLFKRWVAFGLLSSHSRLHGNQSYRVPWMYDEEAAEVTKFFSKLKNQLMPYLFTEAVASHTHGLPMMRAMILEFQKDMTCHYLDQQYMLGSHLLVAPIFNENHKGHFYLPEGSWTHLLTNEVLEGGKWYEEEYHYFSLPLFVREQSIIALGKDKYVPDYQYEQEHEWHVFSLSNNREASAVLHDQNGKKAIEVTAKRENNRYTFSWDTVQSLSDMTFILRNIHSNDVKVENENCQLLEHPLGTLVKAEASSGVVSVRIF